MITCLSTRQRLCITLCCCLHSASMTVDYPFHAFMYKPCNTANILTLHQSLKLDMGWPAKRSLMFVVLSHENNQSLVVLFIECHVPAAIARSVTFSPLHHQSCRCASSNHVFLESNFVSESSKSFVPSDFSAMVPLLVP
jgi:hypothetical protein